MRQLVQSVRDGQLRIVEFPTPEPGPTEVLVATRRSLISSGTESAVRSLASANLVQKAKSRPDLVRQVVDRARADGVRATVRAVRTKLDDDMPLGYSGMGIALSVGETVVDIRPGDRVATASAGHGDHQLVPGLLVAKVPDGVDDASAAFATVGSIALHGLRQAEAGVGATVAVIGLGLVGQLTVRLARASGLRVIGIDLREHLIELARGYGADAFLESGTDTTRTILDITGGEGVDAVLVTAATPSSQPVSRATDILRDRGRIVVVGDVGLELDRRPFYEKELDVRFARSYGPGRYDRSYEQYAIDYPAGYVRWTEGRNLQAFLSLIERGQMQVADLVTRTYTLDDAEAAYASLGGSDPLLGLQFTYPSMEQTKVPDPPERHPKPPDGPKSSLLTSGVIGAGLFARATFFPALKAANWPTPLTITSASGLSARWVADRHQIHEVAASADDMLSDPRVSVIFILSRHDSHAQLAAMALDAGKNVYVEKPLALSQSELHDIAAAQLRSGRLLWSGFNRRHAPAVARARRALNRGTGPLVVSYQVNAGWLPASHWYLDRREGGRLIGEACHFIDTVSWLVGLHPSTVLAFGDGRGELLLQQNFTIALQYPDGSSASISYGAGGSPRTPKERIEVLGRGHTIVVDDFKSLTIDGRKKESAIGKGHRENLEAFAGALGGTRVSEDEMRLSLSTTAVTLAAVESLISGQAQRVEFPT